MIPAFLLILLNGLQAQDTDAIPLSAEEEYHFDTLTKKEVKKR